MQTQRNWLPRDQNKTQNSLSEAERLSIMEALDHIHVTRHYQEMGCCAACKKISLKKCSGCGTFYCSNECQAFDWPKHRMKCSKDKDGVSERGSFSSSRQMRSFPSVKNLDEENKIIPMITNRGSPFTALANQLSKSNSGSVVNDSKGLYKMGNRQYRNNEYQPKETKNNKQFSPPGKAPSFKRYFPVETSKKSNSSQSSCGTIQQNDSIKTVKCVENGSLQNGDIHNRKRSPKPFSDGNMEVVGTYRESPDRYWVMASSNLEKFEEIQSTLNRECKNFESIPPAVGLVCGCTYGDAWFRGKIVAVSPEITVHYMDFGKTSKYNLKILKKLPYNIRSLPPLAFVIEFGEGTPSRYKTANLETEKFTVEEIGKAPDGVSRVKIVCGFTENSDKVNGEDKSEKVDSSRRSAVDSITPISTGILFFTPGGSNTRYASVVPDNHKEANECIEKVLNIDRPKSAPIEATEGDYVLVTDKDGNDQRGRVSLKFGSSYRIQLIDCGSIISTDTVYPIPEHLKNLIELGVKVTIEKIFQEDEMKLETCFFTVNGPCISGKWPCILKTPNKQLVAKVLLEKPFERSELQPKYVQLKSGSTVEISHISSPNSFYVRSVDAEAEQKFLDMNMEMIGFAPKAKHFSVPPPVGELCCAKFEVDNCFYRAIVKSIEKGKVRVLFVDFGNEQDTNLQDIKPLPESLKKVPFFGVKVTLKNVSLKPWNNKIKEYIKKLTTENIEMILTYTESPSNGVVLREKVSGVVVNDFIEKSKTQNVNSNSALSKRKDVFLDDDLTYTIPRTGDVCILAILYINEREFESSQTFWATVAEVDNFKYVNGELSFLISKYCSSVSKPYRPEYRELCLAEFEGSWYRAICAGFEGDVYKVFFVDFGNACELKSESIREMKEEFMSAPALAMNCILYGQERLKGKPELSTKVYTILLDRINTFIKGVTIMKFEDDTFILKIPEIEDILSG